MNIVEICICRLGALDPRSSARYGKRSVRPASRQVPNLGAYNSIIIKADHISYYLLNLAYAIITVAELDLLLTSHFFFPGQPMLMSVSRLVNYNNSGPDPLKSSVLGSLTTLTAPWRGCMLMSTSTCPSRIGNMIASI